MQAYYQVEVHMTAPPNNVHLPQGSRINRAQRTSDWLVKHILPLGWVTLLTGMFWVGDRALYHKLYYLALAAPALLAITFSPRRLNTLLTSPLLIAFALFSLYTLITLAWSSTDTAATSLAKRPLYVFLLFISAGLLAMRAPERLMHAIKASAAIATLAAAVSLGIYLYEGNQERLTGYGALYNPLLSSHVYGALMAIWAANWLLGKSPYEPASLVSLAILGVLLIATGSRTPLIGLAACGAWLALIQKSPRGLALLAAGFLATLTMLFLHPEGLTSRGLSSRPEIWLGAWSQILEAPWFGHGYDAPMNIWISTHDYAMADPHNIMLAVLYYCGFVGLALWLLLYGIAFNISWRNRHDPLTVIASSMLMFGLAASMTEGGAFISRPKEHWFLIWIPMALIFAAEIRIKTENKLHEMA